ncbi:hypothetical protein [Pyruvatibacter mobilis]|uniref:hypothetical protein n=1 Tax=Pyruvatibacter mobilis TaxID=1712261 RepID=UPI003BAD4065
MAGAQPISSQDRKKLAAFSRCLDGFVEIRAAMSVGAIETFVAVANQEGLSLNEYAKVMDAPLSTVSRHLIDMSVKRRNGDVGYDLVIREVDPNNLRQNVYTLSARGKKLRSRIISAVESASS